MTRDEAIERLRAIYPEGATVQMTRRHEARTGGKASISALFIEDGWIHDATPMVCTALDLKFDTDNGGAIIHNPGYRRELWLSDALGLELYGDERALTHRSI